MKKYLSLFILACFTMTTLSAPWVEASFWEERKKVIEGAGLVRASASAEGKGHPPRKHRRILETPARSDRKSVQQFARVPSDLIQNLPSINTQPHNLSSSISASLQKNLPQNFTSTHQHLLKALPPQYGAIRKITTGSHSSVMGSGPSNQKSQIKNQKSPIVLHIQDIHQNQEAQKNIAGAVEALLGHTEVGLVALEGAFGALDVKRYHDYPRKDTMKVVADDLLKRNQISGPIYTAFTTTKKIVPFVGIDDTDQYEQNVQAYLNSIASHQNDKIQWDKIKQQIHIQKKKVYSSALWTFDQKAQDYHDKNISLSDFLKIMTNHVPTQKPNISLFAKALAYEENLDFKKVEAERALLVNRLTKQLSQKDITQLIEMSMAYRSGKINYAGFYGFLDKLCARAKISLAHYPAMKKYIAYVLLSDKINAAHLLTEIRNLEKQVYAQLAKTPEEKALIQKSRTVCLTEKLLKFSLTPEEWKEYKNIGSVFGQQPNINLKMYEQFYIQAENRNTSMADNLLKAMKKHNANVSVLVTGGFHAQGMEKILTDANVSVINFVPKITKVDTEKGSSYLSVFSQEKTPLQKLFEAEELFVAKTPMAKTVDVDTTLGMMAVEGTQKNPMPAEQIARLLLGPKALAKLRKAYVEFKAGMCKAFLRIGDHLSSRSFHVNSKSLSSVIVRQAPWYVWLRNLFDQQPRFLPPEEEAMPEDGSESDEEKFSEKPVWLDDKSPLVMGHRGVGWDGEKVKDNSREALSAAFDRGIGAEFDVQPTSDGVLVVKKHPRVRVSYDDIKAKKPDLMTLEEVFVLALEFEKRVPLMVDLSWVDGKDKAPAEEIVRLVNKYPALEGWVVVNSMTMQDLVHVREAAEKTGVLIYLSYGVMSDSNIAGEYAFGFEGQSEDDKKTVLDRIIKKGKKEEVSFLGFYPNDLSLETAQQLQTEGFVVFAGDKIIDRERAEQMIGTGADIVQASNVDELLNITQVSETENATDWLSWLIAPVAVILSVLGLGDYEIWAYALAGVFGTLLGFVLNDVLGHGVFEIGIRKKQFPKFAFDKKGALGFRFFVKDSDGQEASGWSGLAGNFLGVVLFGMAALIQGQTTPFLMAGIVGNLVFVVFSWTDWKDVLRHVSWGNIVEYLRESVCHETVHLMRADPSASACTSRCQTALSGWVQKAWS